VRFGNFDGCIAAGGERLQLGCAAGSEWLRAAGDLGMTSIYSCSITPSVDHLRLRRKSPAAAKSEHCSQPREPLQNATIEPRGGPQWLPSRHQVCEYRSGHLVIYSLFTSSLNHYLDPIKDTLQLPSG
jgi:hypothetical protein